MGRDIQVVLHMAWFQTWTLVGLRWGHPTKLWHETTESWGWGWEELAMRAEDRKATVLYCDIWEASTRGTGPEIRTLFYSWLPISLLCAFGQVTSSLWASVSSFYKTRWRIYERPPFTSKELMVLARSLGTGWRNQKTGFHFITWAPEHFLVGSGNRNRRSVTKLIWVSGRWPAALAAGNFTQEEGRGGCGLDGSLVLLPKGYDCHRGINVYSDWSSVFRGSNVISWCFWSMGNSDSNKQ